MAGEFFVDSSFDMVWGSFDIEVIPWGSATVNAVGWHWGGDGGALSPSTESDDGNRLIGLTAGVYVTNDGRKFPGSGIRSYSGELHTYYGAREGTGEYWSSSAPYNETISCLIFSKGGMGAYGNYPRYSLSVRCLLDQ
jgi:hypothetical protein